MAILSKGNTFADGDQVTSAKLNNLVDNATFVAGGDGTTDNATLEVNGSGTLQVKTIQTGNIASNAVTTAKIADSNVTTAKIADSNVTTAKIANDAVTNDKIADNAIQQAQMADGSVGTAEIINANVTAAKLDGAQTGSAPIFGVRAWAKLNPYVGSVRTGAYKTGTYSRTTNETTVTIVNHGLKTNDKIRLDFTSGGATDGLYTVTSSANTNEFVVNHTGTAASGNVTAEFIQIQGSGNVSTASWYDNGDNRIVLNFTTPMPNVNYATLVTTQHYPGDFISRAAEDTLGTTQLNTIYQGHVYDDNDIRFLNVMFIG